MKIICYSDIHLEIEKGLTAPADTDADIMILAGDILNMCDPAPFSRFVAGFDKPILFVAGNHEYYEGRPMSVERDAFAAWLTAHHPNVLFLRDESVTIDGIHFFGGTMWTDFAGADAEAMAEAESRMHDYQRITGDHGGILRAADTLPLHNAFAQKLIAWLDTPMAGKRVVITHHAPCLHPQSMHDDSPLIPAFNSLNMMAVIENYQPDIWYYGHTHECDRQKIGRTQMLSNQLGYEKNGKFECADDFDPTGALIVL